MGRGQFIVLEGVDGSGTSTQAAMLAAAFRERGRAVHLTQEPSSGPVGCLLRLFLSRRLVVGGRRGPKPPRMETMALLFAADRVDHLEHEILPNLRDNITVICDRYLHSSVAYQSLTAGEETDQARRWIEEINARSRLPDQVLVLDVPADEALRRRMSRGGAEEMYEHDELQQRLALFYQRLPELYPDQSIAIIDGNRPVDQVHRDCVSLVMEAAC